MVLSIDYQSYMMTADALNRYDLALNMHPRCRTMYQPRTRRYDYLVFGICSCFGDRLLLNFAWKCRSWYRRPNFQHLTSDIFTMTTEAQSTLVKKVAVIGGGCSGIAALWALKDSGHDVYMYEADDRLGGHTNTVQWKAGKYSVGVDTGFIVLNTVTYRAYMSSSSVRKCCRWLLSIDLHIHVANFIKFLNKMKLETEPTRMDLSVSRDFGTFEWAGQGLASVFCQRKNLFSAHMWRMRSTLYGSINLPSTS